MASTGTARKAARPRPLSPHLGIYRLTLTMAMSGAHRITALALYAGTLLLAWFLLAASTDASAFSWFSAFIHSFIGQLVLFGYTWSLFHHLFGGVRHFIWDAGHGFEAPQRDQLAAATLAASLVLTVVVWIIGFIVR
jgi:succinate dehydrogenase / fumarate reductase cytochrome b subunit